MKQDAVVVEHMQEDPLHLAVDKQRDRETGNLLEPSRPHPAPPQSQVISRSFQNLPK